MSIDQGSQTNRLRGTIWRILNLLGLSVLDFPSSGEVPPILVHAGGEIKLILFSASTSTL
jgi:hypothetical protein